MSADTLRRETIDNIDKEHNIFPLCQNSGKGQCVEVGPVSVTCSTSHSCSELNFILLLRVALQDSSQAIKESQMRI